MVNNCCIEGCSRGWIDGKYRGFHFPLKKRPDIISEWTKFVDKKHWSPTEYSTLCYEHFHDNLYKRGGRWTLNWHLSPIPTLYPPDVPEVCSPVIPKRTANMAAQYIECKKRLIVKFDSFSSEHSPSGYQFRRQGNHVLYYYVHFDESTGFPSIRECIKVNQELHVQLQYEGSTVPLPSWFRSKKCRVTHYSDLHQLSKDIRMLVETMKDESDVLLDEMQKRRFYKRKGGPPYSAAMIAFALHLRYTSLQAYMLLFGIFPFPSVSLLQKIQQGGVDSVKALQRLRESGDISTDILLMVDEMYLQKCAQYQNGEYVGEDENGDLYKGVVVFMVEGLRKSIPFVLHAIPEVKISGEWLSPKITGCIDSLGKAGFVTRAVCVDNHSSNVNAYNRLKIEHMCTEDEYGIFHPSNDFKKTYLFFDTVHILKNIRNNLIAAKKFVFPSFEFKNSNIDIQCPAGYISWSDMHKIYEKDVEQQANLKKAPNLSFQSLHPGNNKQSVTLALAIFHDTTIVAAKAYFPARKDLAGFLSIINTWWKISNSKERYHPDPVGSAVVLGDGKLDFLRYLASWLERWSESPYFTLTSQTSLALTTTLNAHCQLINELLSDDGYDFVMTGRLQSDPVERRISQYRSMSGGRFLVSLREVINSERILACRSLIKEGITFWSENEDLRPDDTDRTSNELLALADIRLQSVDILECHLNESSAEVATTISGYVAKKLKKRSHCEACKVLLSSNKLDLDNNHYLNLLSRGGLTVPPSTLAELTCSCFAMLDFISPILQKYNVVNVRRVLMVILDEFSPKMQVTCATHDNWGRHFCFKIIINVFFNNKQKVSVDTSRKNSLAAFKQRQRTKN